ncbi:SPASM domain-containing protein [Streptomyces sp. MnatMP-M17]|uniref:SPASM domain-containing protein n=1 Tax=Streptomyces sp. MnatMP-M17 TaxID=1839780 RepID=UPI0035230B66
MGRCGTSRPTVADLCGQCAQGKLAIGPDGDVWPCVIGRFISLGNVLVSPLKDIWAGPATRRARAEIEAGQSAQQHVLLWAADLKATAHHLIEESATSHDEAAYHAGSLYKDKLSALRDSSAGRQSA